MLEIVEEAFSNPMFVAGLALGIVIVFGYLKLKYPVLVKMARANVDEAVVFFAANKEKVPDEFKGIVEDAEMTLNDLKAALSDEEIDYKEVYLLSKDFLAIADELKGIVLKA